ncbi:cytochrome P450 [Coprinellus micaceus]|uniref:Cytochrome P450 n=1 Tax=Coprinellus micaceus TaxID=71717 RepID=A0A4Y7TBG8_COPMI|nr:cytochrome P450 [Coprinellus micaceus]
MSNNSAQLATRLLTSLAATFGAYGAYKALSFFYDNWTSTIRRLPGPPSSSFIWGNMKEIFDAENSTLHEQWVKEYGKTIRYKGILGMNRLYTTDLKAINHVLMNNYIYQKPAAARFGLSQILGNGVLVTEEDKHKQQRRIMNPAFGAGQIRELTGVFFEKAIELRDAWMSQIQSKEDKGAAETINVLAWLSRTTLDVIGLAGFSYKFNALAHGEDASELMKAFSKIFESGASFSIIPFLRGMFPALRWLPAERDADTKEARATMDRIGRELLIETKTDLKKSGRVDKDSLKARDLLTILVRANMATDIPEHQRMSDTDVLAQVPTFLVAGHETTSTSTTWALYALSKDLEVQRKLREELLQVSTDDPTMDELNALPYLDAVTRETLRLHAPVSSTLRVAVKDDTIPLSTPVTDRDGKTHEYLHVRKGQTLFVPIVPINRDAAIWGEDGHEFKPERWESVPARASAIPGVWGNSLTFLGGPRACIGYRFSVIEMKAILFTLIRAFEFEFAVPVEDIGKKSTLVSRPFLRSDPKAGNQLPLKVRPYARPL